MTDGIKKFGRPEKPIDWELVDSLIEAGCPSTEIAPHFHLTPEAFRERLEKKYGMYFSIYSSIFEAKGAANIRHQQYLKALGKADKGDNTMLVWLGKNRLKQRDAPIDMQVTQAQVDINEAVMAQLSKNQESAKEALESSKEEKLAADDHTESHSDS